MNYYGTFYRSALYGLRQCINTYLIRWVRKKFNGYAHTIPCKTWWNRLAERKLDLFAHWAWMRAFSWIG